MNIVQRAFTHFTIIPGRPRVGIVLHNTEGTTPIATKDVAGSWHWLIDRDGTIYRDVLETHAAWHVARCDEWRPPWMLSAPRHLGISDANYCTIGIELVGHQSHRDAGEPYTAAQYAALRELLTDIIARNAQLGQRQFPIVAHGQLQLDRTDPVAFDWLRAGLVQLGGSWWLEPIAPEPSPQPPETAPGDDMATIAELQGIITEYEHQVAALRQEIAGKDSELGALRVDVLIPLEAELASVKRELAACQAAAQTMPGVSHITLEGAVHLADGTRLLVPVRS